MANLDKYKRLQLNLAPLGDIDDPRDNSASNLNGVSDFQRFVLKNFFDTQPKRRSAYFRRLGYEMNPKNPEEYRPVGHDGAFKNIEPEGPEVEVKLGFLSFPNLFSEQGRAELINDIKDIGFDLGVEGPLVGAAITGGGAKGAAIGLVAPVPGGTAIGGFAGAFAGGAGGKAIVETVKEGIGDFFLDETVPLDNQQLLYQSLVSGGFGAAGRGLGKMVGNWKKMRADQISKSLKEAAIRKSNGKFNQNLIDDLAENPEKYTPEAVKGATKELLSLSDEIFGTSVANPKSTRQLTGGVAKEAIKPLNTRADLEMAKLSNLPEANFSYDEIRGLLIDRTRGIANKKFRTQDEQKAMTFVESELKRLKATLGTKKAILGPSPEGAPVQQPIEFSELPFGEGRDFLKSLQGVTFSEGPLKGNLTMVKISRGMRELADEKASLVGSDLASINKRRSEILNTYKNMQTMIKDGSLQNAFIGDDLLSKQNVIRVFGDMDDKLDTQLVSRIRETQFRSAVERLFDKPAAFGSGSVITDAIRGGLSRAPKEAFKFGALGTVAGPAVAAKAAGVGAVTGFVRGAKEGAALSSPRSLIQKFSKIKTRIDKIESSLTGPESTRQAAAAGARSVSGQLGAQFDQPLSTAVLPPEQQTGALIQDPTSGIGPANPQPSEVGEPGAVVKQEEDPLAKFRSLRLNLEPLGQ